MQNKEKKCIQGYLFNVHSRSESRCIIIAIYNKQAERRKRELWETISRLYNYEVQQSTVQNATQSKKERERTAAYKCISLHACIIRICLINGFAIDKKDGQLVRWETPILPVEEDENHQHQSYSKFKAALHLSKGCFG